MKGEYVFTQICRFLPKEEFNWFIKKYDGNKTGAMRRSPYGPQRCFVRKA